MSNKVKFTPAPWVAKYEPHPHYGDGVIESKVGDIAIVCGSNYGFSPGGPNRNWQGDFDDENEAEANAHLIAAAPELYAIVDRIVNYRASENDGVPLDDNDRFFDDAMAALAKARGEQQ